MEVMYLLWKALHLVLSRNETNVASTGDDDDDDDDDGDGDGDDDDDDDDDVVVNTFNTQ